jgi:hypothetical protein
MVESDREKMGAPATPSGSREPDPSCTGSGPSGFDPSRGRLDALAAKAETEVPYCWQMGRYTFFAGCAWGMSLTVSVIFRAWGFERITESGAPALVAIVAFLALRDMSKPWGMARKATAIAMEARQGGDGETRLHAKHDSAGPKDIAQRRSNV